MNENIKIGRVLVPLEDYAVGASAVLGIRDSGKTVTSKGICEQLIEHGVQPIIFDAVGKWRWMKVAAEHAHGKAYKIVVAGGREPDLPLTPHSVPEIIRAALKERIPLVIDLFSKSMSKADWRKIVQTAIHIIHYENEGGAVHVFLEEAAEFVPQKIYDGETYAEVEKLVRMGGNASVGITLINQRSQEVNKAVLDNCSTALVLGCQVGKNAIQAVESWIEKLDSETAEEVTTSLPKLKAGEAWVWTRKSLTHPTREQMPMCRSFHPDRRTPEIILKSARPTDTAEFVAKMAASIPKVIEEAKANDPAELKREVARLKREAAKRSPQAAMTDITNVPALTDHERTRLTKLIESYEHVESSTTRIGEMINEIHREVQLSRAEATFFKLLLQEKLSPAGVQAPRAADGQHQASRARNRLAPSRITDARVAPPAGESFNGDWKPSKCQRAILAVLATNGPCDIRKAAVLARYSVGGTLRTELSSLRTNGCINGANSEPMQITEHGLAFGPFEQMPDTPEERIAWWKSHPSIGLCKRKVIDALKEQPDGLDIHELANAAGYEVGGTFRTELSGLRTAGVIVGRNSQKMTLNPDLFA